MIILYDIGREEITSTGTTTIWITSSRRGTILVCWWTSDIFLLCTPTAQHFSFRFEGTDILEEGLRWLHETDNYNQTSAGWSLHCPSRRELTSKGWDNEMNLPFFMYNQAILTQEILEQTYYAWPGRKTSIDKDTLVCNWNGNATCICRAEFHSKKTLHKIFIGK